MLRPEKKHSLQNEFLALHTFIHSPSSHCFPSVLFSWEREAQAFIGQCIHTAERSALGWNQSSSKMGPVFYFWEHSPGAVHAVDQGWHPHQQQLWKEGETLSLSLQRSIPTSYSLQIVFSLALGHSCSSSWVQCFDFKVQVIIIFSSSFRKPWNILCSSGHPARRSELRETEASRLQKLCRSELGRVTSLAIVCNLVPSQEVKLIWFNLNDLFSFNFFPFFIQISKSLYFGIQIGAIFRLEVADLYLLTLSKKSPSTNVFVQGIFF